MTRNLKALGLALLAICAMGALAAQGASAAIEHEFESDGAATVITGENIEGNDKFAVGTAGTVECTGTKIEATQKGTTADELTVVPHYSGCTFGGKEAVVNFNHCAYVFDSDTGETGTVPNVTEHANVKVECAEGSEIEIDTSLCTITVGPQTIKHAVRYEKDTGSSVKVNTTAKEVVVGKKVSTPGVQTGCVLFPTGPKGTYTGKATTKCFTDEGTELKETATTTPTEQTKEGGTTACGMSNLPA